MPWMIRNWVEHASLTRLAPFRSLAFGHISLDVLFDWATNLGSAAENRGARAVNSDGRNDGSAIAVGWSCPALNVLPWPLPGLRVGDHRIGPVRNPDASRYFCAPDSGVLAPHD
jgi:hypothetical protein